MKLNSMLGTLYDEPLLLEPISRTPRMSIFSSIPFIGSDGASTLDNYPVAEKRIMTKYGCPDLPGRTNHRLKDRIMGMTSRVYGSIKSKLGSYFANQTDSEYVAAVDAFRPDMAPIGGAVLPVGQTDAFYSPNTDTRALDEGTIYGTSKNKALRSLYRSSIRVAGRIGGSLGEKLRNFYRNILNGLEDTKYAESTMAHESIHSGLEKTRLAHDLSVPQNEGLTCALTDEVMGKSSTTKGTAYHGFKKRAYRALYRLGYKSASQFIRSYVDGKISGGKFARAYARVK